MKLNLVADFVVPGTGGKRFVATFAIHASNNLMGLPDMVCQSFPARGGEFFAVRPKTLTMCGSAKKADAVAESWRETYKSEGRLWDFSSIDPYWAKKELESEVA